MHRYALIAGLFTTLAVSALADTNVPLKDIENIKTYTPTKFESERPRIKIGSLVKIMFLSQETLESSFQRQADVNKEDSFEAVLEDGKMHAVRVVVPNSVRNWFLKIPTESYEAVKPVTVIGRVENDCVRLLGTEIRQGFKDATISWAGHEDAAADR